MQKWYMFSPVTVNRRIYLVSAFHTPPIIAADGIEVAPDAGPASRPALGKGKRLPSQTPSPKDMRESTATAHIL